MSWPSPLTLCIAWYTPLCIIMMRRTRTISTQLLVSPSGMHTCACMCHALLHLADKDPDCWRIYEGSHLIVPHGTQHRTLFPEIVMPPNHQGPLIDPNTGEPYHMAAAGDFCLMDMLFPGSPGDSLLFKEDDLNRLKRKGFHVSSYREEKPQPTFPKEDKHQSSCIKEHVPSSSCKEEESLKTSGRNSGASSPQASDSTSSKKSSHWGKCSPLAKEQPDDHDAKDHCSLSKHKDRSCSDKSSRCGSDKESSNIPHKHALSPTPHICSTECPQKGPCVDEPSNIPGESSHASYRSPSRSMRIMGPFEDHGFFTVPTSSSTANKLRTQLHYQSSSTNSRLSMTPLDMGLYNSFSPQLWPPSFNRWGHSHSQCCWVAVCLQQHMAAPWTDFPAPTVTLNAE